MLYEDKLFSTYFFGVDRLFQTRDSSLFCSISTRYYRKATIPAVSLCNGWRSGLYGRASGWIVP